MMRSEKNTYFFLIYSIFKVKHFWFFSLLHHFTGASIRVYNMQMWRQWFGPSVYATVDIHGVYVRSFDMRMLFSLLVLWIYARAHERMNSANNNNICAAYDREFFSFMWYLRCVVFRERFASVDVRNKFYLEKIGHSRHWFLLWVDGNMNIHSAGTRSLWHGCSPKIRLAVPALSMCSAAHKSMFWVK